MRIGLFGGTFNPIHYGHLRGAEEVREMFKLDKVVFIPSGIPPLKGSGVIEGLHRLKMVMIATKDNPYFEVSDYEINLNQPSYTIKTVGYFKELYQGHTLFFIIGVDSFLELPKWYKPEELLKIIDFIVMSRPNYDILDSKFTLICDKEGQFNILNSDRKLYYAEISPISVSSTFLRECIKTKRSIRYLTPEDVISYIDQHKLYRESYELF